MHTHLPVLVDISDPVLSLALQHTLDNKTKPRGSLGVLETLARQLGEILGAERPVLRQPQMLVFAGDHGLAARGVSAYPSDVTWQMVENFLTGGAAVSVLARQHDIALTVVDCGVAHDFAPREPADVMQPRLVNRKIAHGTADASTQSAMSTAQCVQAVTHGCELVRSLSGNAVLLGEMGIGNSAAAALLMSRLAGLDIALCTGAGTGLDAAGITRKTEVLRAVLQ
ncbi:MAG: nicotinate-nucleotide--dimethylbenzimidazole phosphoribosyltransferase, partial [Rhodoferax sp.]|nr:nicotinate-nucleotide--dimethylbenzimidazole phosphoribosyltransferase [Rhodoferax sp.]